MNIEYHDIDDDFFCAQNLHDDLDVGWFELDNNGWRVATNLWQVRPRERWENGQYDQYYWCLKMLMVRMMVIYRMTTLTLINLDHPGVCSSSDLSPFHQDGKIPLDRFAAILEVIRSVVESLTILLLSS